MAGLLGVTYYFCIAVTSVPFFTKLAAYNWDTNRKLSYIGLCSSVLILSVSQLINWIIVYLTVSLHKENITRKEFLIISMGMAAQGVFAIITMILYYFSWAPLLLLGILLVQPVFYIIIGEDPSEDEEEKSILNSDKVLLIN